MATSEVFAKTADLLVAATRMEALTARGTIRLALKAAGLDAASVGAEQMSAVLRNLLPAELQTRGVRNAPEICAQLEAQLAAAKLARTSDGVDRAASIFERLGGG